MLNEAEWAGVGEHLVTRGWARLCAVLEPHVLAELDDAAPDAWSTLPEIEQGVRQAGIACHSSIDDAKPIVRAFAEAIRAGISTVTPLPEFNHAEWCVADDGAKFITPHRDPPTAGGVIAVLTIRGAATFRVWDSDGVNVNEWTTADGDLVLMCGGGWPTPRALCPMHEAESPVSGDRVTLTLRHNKGGYGADYFAISRSAT